jgi:hypothetical protein
MARRCARQSGGRCRARFMLRRPGAYAPLDPREGKRDSGSLAFPYRGSKGPGRPLGRRRHKRAQRSARFMLRRPGAYAPLDPREEKRDSGSLAFPLSGVPRGREGPLAAGGIHKALPLGRQMASKALAKMTRRGYISNTARSRPRPGFGPRPASTDGRRFCPGPPQERGWRFPRYSREVSGNAGPGAAQAASGLFFDLTGRPGQPRRRP